MSPGRHPSGLLRPGSGPAASAGDGGDGDRSGAGNVLAEMVRLAQLSSLRRRGGSCKGAVA